MENFLRRYRDYRQDIDIVRYQYPSTDLIWVEETLILKFSDAVQLLNKNIPSLDAAIQAGVTPLLPFMFPGLV